MRGRRQQRRGAAGKLRLRFKHALRDLAASDGASSGAETLHAGAQRHCADVGSSDEERRASLGCVWAAGAAAERVGSQRAGVAFLGHVAYLAAAKCSAKLLNFMVMQVPHKGTRG